MTPRELAFTTGVSLQFRTGCVLTICYYKHLNDPARTGLASARLVHRPRPHCVCRHIGTYMYRERERARERERGRESERARERASERARERERGKDRKSETYTRTEREGEGGQHSFEGSEAHGQRHLTQRHLTRRARARAARCGCETERCGEGAREAAGYCAQ